MQLSSITYCGGLGNQLFQICTLMSYSLDTNRIPVLAYSTVSPSCTFRETYWDSVFSPFENFAKVCRGTVLEVKDAFEYITLPKNIQGTVSLEGYFQSYKYFDHNFEKIKEFFSFEEKKCRVKEKYFSILSKKQEENEILVAIHFRLGDYKNLKHIHPLLPTSYYQNAMKLLPEKKKIILLVFCEQEDKKFVQENYLNLVVNENMEIRKIPSSIPDWEQMFLMSLCDWNIIANSTFSWWGAYLKTKRENVFLPSIWFHEATSENLIPPGWSPVSIHL